LTGSWLGFEDATITITVNAADPAQGRFAARLLVPGSTNTGQPLTQLDGHWICSDQLLITAIALGVT
jgi:4'-phosphopantetheinyl transferase EntD